jgi:hypothetical protein
LSVYAKVAGAAKAKFFDVRLQGLNVDQLVVSGHDPGV